MRELFHMEGWECGVRREGGRLQKGGGETEAESAGEGLSAVRMGAGAPCGRTAIS